MTAQKLTNKQKMFCREYLVDRNSTQAAIRAGYSPRRAKEMGYENHTKPHVAEYLTQLIDKRNEKVEYSANDLLTDMLDVLKIAKVAAQAGESASLSAFKGLADSVGKHVNVQGFSEKQVVEHQGSITHDTTAMGSEVLSALFERRRDEQERGKQVH